MAVDKHPLNYLSPRDGDYALEWEELEEPRRIHRAEDLRPEDRAALGLTPHAADETHLLGATRIQGAEHALTAALLRATAPGRR